MNPPGSVVAAVLGALAFGVFVASPIRQVGDSHYTVLLSESLLHRGSFALDPYFRPPLDATRYPGLRENGYPYQIDVREGHPYYHFPVGTSVLCVPFAAALELFGVSAIAPDGGYDPSGEVKAQGLIAAFLMAVATAVFFLTARLLLPLRPSVVVALWAAFATQLWSTASRALWSHTWSILLLAVAVWILARVELQGRPLPAAGLASSMAWMYLVRPTGAIPLVLVTGYVLWRHRTAVRMFLAVLVFWLTVFAAYSWLVFGTLQPAYYQPASQSGGDFFAGFGANLVSPSRGLLVQVPLLIVAAVLLARHRQAVPVPRLALIAVAGIVGLFAPVSLSPFWHGGFCYGPRLTSDLVPWVVLLVVLAAKATFFSSRAQDPAPWPGSLRGPVTSVAVAMGAGLFVHAYGALSAEPFVWNERPYPVYEHPERVWSWRDPQFLAGLLPPDVNQDLPVLPLNAEIVLGAGRGGEYLWRGWSAAEASFRWTDGARAEMAFAAPSTASLLLRLKAGPFLVRGRLDRQRVGIEMNGTRIETLDLTGAEEGRERVIALPREVLKGKNLLRLELPDSASPAALGLSADKRRLGLRVESLTFSPFPVLAEGSVLGLGDERAAPYLGSGWSRAEPPFRWTVGRTAKVFVGLESPRTVLLRMKLWPLIVPGRLNKQRLGVEVNGRRVASLEITAPQVCSVAIPPALLRESTVLVFDLPDAEAPARLGLSADERRLGVAVEWLGLEAPPGFARAQRVAVGGPSIEANLGGGWSYAEGIKRWTDGPRAELAFALDDAGPAVLEMRMEAPPTRGRPAPQRVQLQLNGSPVGSILAEGPAPRTHAVGLTKGTLQGVNVLTLDLPDATPPGWVAGDPRRLGVAVHWLRLRDVPAWAPGERIDLASEKAEPYLGDGWSQAEGYFRWTDGAQAEVFFSMGQPKGAKLELNLHPFLVPGWVPRQHVELEINGRRLATLEVTSPEAGVYRVLLPPGALEKANVLRLGMPDAQSPRGLGLHRDPRRLGIAVRWIRIALE